MKTLIPTVILFILTIGTSISQPVTENVMFDNYVSPSDNDLVNNFSGNILLTPTTTNGITGGCLATPTTESWGNNNAIYCSKYINSAAYSSSTRISFKYDTTQLNSINFDRAVSIFLRPNADFNHYIIASITPDKKIQVVSYFAANNPVSVNLLHNPWYEFILNTSFTTPAPTYQVATDAQLNDLGLTGLTPPIPAGNTSLSFTDSLLYVDTAVQVSFSGTSWGGAKYIDNFRFEGFKSADSCNAPTGIPAVIDTGVEVFVSGNTIECTSSHDKLMLHVYSISGQLLFSKEIRKGHSSIPIVELANGIYLLKISGSSSTLNITKKIVVLK